MNRDQCRQRGKGRDAVIGSNGIDYRMVKDHQRELLEEGRRAKLRPVRHSRRRVALGRRIAASMGDLLVAAGRRLQELERVPAECPGNTLNQGARY